MDSDIKDLMEPEDLKKIVDAIERNPLGGYDMGEIARLSGLLKDRGIPVVPYLDRLCKQYRIDTSQRWARDTGK